MAPPLEISIPSTSIAHADSKPYTLYTISLRLPLRSYTIQKRYTDFVSLHSSLTEAVGTPPPAAIPGKSWFKSTVSSPELTEQRRAALETYLQTINTDSDSRWRNTPIWRAFLNLPSTFSTTNTTASSLQSTLTAPSRDQPITDPTVWLDTHRDLKQNLHNARLQLTTRDQASTPQAQHEASASAKSHLVKSNTLISALDAGLQKAPTSLGAGEVRRRKDLLSAARKDHAGLESLLNAMSQKSRLDSAVANIQDHDSLLNTNSSSAAHSAAHSRSSSTRPTRGRVLGKETNETRELDNAGILQLQQQKMKDQDLDVDELRKIVMRQRELGVKINEELEIQNEMLRMVDEDVDRVQGKIDVAKRRVDKIK